MVVLEAIPEGGAGFPCGICCGCTFFWTSSGPADISGDVVCLGGPREEEQSELLAFLLLLLLMLISLLLEDEREGTVGIFSNENGSGGIRFRSFSTSRVLSFSFIGWRTKRRCN